MTFLELVQRAAEESGTIDLANLPSAVTGQSGRALRFVNWTKRAWEDIQRSRTDWLWLVKSFSGTTTDGTRYYASADSRFAEWVIPDTEQPFAVYETSEGQSDETFPTLLSWEDFRYTALVGSAAATTGRPTAVAIDPANQIATYPIPDSTGFTLRGWYRRGPQTLSADGDEPEMPARFHPAIVWRTLVYSAIFDENEAQAGAWQAMYREAMSDLVAAETAPVSVSWPLA